MAAAVPQPAGVEGDGACARASDPRGLCVDRQLFRSSQAALPTGDRRQLRKSDVKSAVAHARGRRQTAARRKENSCTARNRGLYSCSHTPGRDRTCDLSFRKAPLYPTELREQQTNHRSSGCSSSLLRFYGPSDSATRIARIPAQQAAAGREVPDDCGLRLIVVCATGRRTLLRRTGCRKKP